MRATRERGSSRSRALVYVSGRKKAGFVVGARLPPGGSTLTATAAIFDAGWGSDTTTKPRPSGTNVALGETAFDPGAIVQAWYTRPAGGGGNVCMTRYTWSAVRKMTPCGTA